MGTTRRQIIVSAGAAALAPTAAWASPDTMRAAMDEFTGGKIAMPGKVTLELPALVENGNSVPVRILVETRMTPEDYVSVIALFSEKNPESNIGRFHLGARSGKAEVSTRIRLADSQRIVAVAKLSDGSFWSGNADLIVTLPACVET